ncbi:50S ribosomal protein L29 [bacterium]|nr:50S ribosomal protein L29 [bacterium]
MKASEIKLMSIEEIKHKVAEKKAALMHIRFQKKIGQLTDTSKFNKTKREIARLLTILREKENSNGKE